MLDINIDKIFSIEASLPNKVKRKPKVLLLRACNMYIFSEDRIYSELEAQTFDLLNDSIGYGMLDIEFVFENNIESEVYPQFYTKCFVIRTDTELKIKPMKMTNFANASKINQNGELVIGIRYYFRDKEEIEKIITSENLLVEGFVALGKPTNTYGVMCQLQKKKKHWKISDAYTYRPKGCRNIKHLMD